MRVVDLKALAKERGLRGYSRLKKAKLIAFIRDNLQPHARPPPQEPIDDRPRPPPRPIPTPRPPPAPRTRSPRSTRPPPPPVMYPSQATPGDSHIVIAPGVGFSLFCLAWEVS